MAPPEATGVHGEPPLTFAPRALTPFFSQPGPEPPCILVPLEATVLSRKLCPREGHSFSTNWPLT